VAGSTTVDNAPLFNQRQTNYKRSDAGNSIVQEVFGFVKKNLSGAQRRNNASRERGAGKGAAVPFSASAM